MRITYVIEKISQRGGVERILIDKLNYLAEHSDYEIVLMTVWKDKKETAFPINKKVRIVNLNIPFFDFPGGYVPSLPFALYSFNRNIKKINPDITVFFRAVGSFLCAATSWKGKKIFESHTPFHFSNHKWLYHFVQRKADAIVCLTDGDAKDFHEASRVDVIANFTNVKTDRSADYSRKNVVFVGRDCPEKDIPRLKRIWSALKNRYPEWNLCIHHDTIDIVKAYLDGSIYVMTSKAEGFGLVLVEAMTCGLPCIAFDCPYGPRDIIEDGETGYLIPYDDDRSFIEKLSLLMDNENLRRQMGEAAKESSERYRPELIMEQWNKLFSSL